MTPSTEWKERIAPDEEARFANYAEQFGALQAKRSAQTGPGRALHRKQLVALTASFEVLPNLPEHARHGLFAAPGTHRAWVRLSNGGAAISSDLRPDVRGFALKIFDVASGPAALGNGQATTHDFLMINHEAFSLKSSDDFVGVAMASANGQGALLKHIFARHGLIGGFKLLKRLGASFNGPFTGFATEKVFTAAPIACGPYAVKARLVPSISSSGDGKPKADWAADFKAHLAKAPLTWEMQLQFFTSEAETPIEDPTVKWPTPWVTVGALTVAQQSDDAGLAKHIEAAKFDPWGGLMAHRPLGDVMRARKAAYFTSQKARGA